MTDSHVLSKGKFNQGAHMQHGGSGGIFELVLYWGVPDRISTTILGFVLIFQVEGEGWGVILVGYQNSSRDHDEYDKKQRKNEQKDSEETFTLPIFKFVMFNQGF